MQRNYDFPSFGLVHIKDKTSDDGKVTYHVMWDMGGYFGISGDTMEEVEEKLADRMEKHLHYKYTDLLVEVGELKQMFNARPKKGRKWIKHYRRDK